MNVFVGKNDILKNGDFLKTSYDFTEELTIIKKPCTILFILATDEISKTGQIVLV